MIGAEAVTDDEADRIIRRLDEARTIIEQHVPNHTWLDEDDPACSFARECAGWLLADIEDRPAIETREEWESAVAAAIRRACGRILVEHRRMREALPDGHELLGEVPPR